MTAYYNEIDPYAAQWLRNLISAGHIAPGDVDERDIRDVHPDDLRRYRQCHFFAGIGVWSHALRLAGWPDDRPVWTGSCPCQPFSAAGRGAGFADERHLWPAFHHLIRECRPAVVLGEQVASKDGLSWLDLVQTDLEGTGYASAAVDLCAAGIGAPHIRQRLWWVGERQGRVAYPDSAITELTPRQGARSDQTASARPYGELDRSGDLDRLADAYDAGLEGRLGVPERAAELAAGQGSVVGGLADATGSGWAARLGHVGQTRDELHNEGRGEIGGLADARRFGWGESGIGHHGRNDRSVAYANGQDDRPRPADGFWRDADWLFCRDGKWRPVSAKPQPLVDGSAESLGRVRPEIIRAVEEEMNAWSVESQIDRNQALRDLLAHLGTETQRCWEAGRVPELHEAPFLLAFLRQLKTQGWRDAQRLPLSCEEIRETVLRSMRPDAGLAGPSRRYELAEQLAPEPADPLSVLSSLLARHARTAWGDAYDAYAETQHPLAHGARNRVGRLRAYGNAIVAQAAAAFVTAYVEASMTL